MRSLVANTATIGPSPRIRNPPSSTGGGPSSALAATARHTLRILGLMRPPTADQFHPPLRGLEVDSRINVYANPFRPRSQQLSR